MSAYLPSSLVSSQFFSTGPFAFKDGTVLDEITIAYETYGTLNPDQSNGVLLFHALSGHQHAAGFNPEVPGTGELWTEECQHGWWDDFIGPGRALDTDRFFVICANYLGGCYGSTGPGTINPRTGRPYGSAFPHLSTADVVRSQAALLDHLGVKKLDSVMGASIGGLLALSFATLFPERVAKIISIASGVRTTVLSRLFCFEQVIAIENDPHFNSGDYYGDLLPEYGLALARMISHKTFVHLDSIERRARRDVVQPEDRLQFYKVGHNVESYMLHQGKKFVRRFDANTYLRIMEMWLSFDPVGDGGAKDARELFHRCQEHGHQWLIFSINSDFCFYPEEQAELVRDLKKAGVNTMHLTVHSEKGHDSFLLEPALYTPHLNYLLNGK